MGPITGSLPDHLPVITVPTPHDIAAAYRVSPGVVAHDCFPDWSTWRDEHEAYPCDSAPQPQSMIYTSGTTGRPKGVRRIPGSAPPAATAAFFDDVFRIFGLAPGVRTVIAGPMYHAGPSMYALMAARLGGLVVLQPRFNAEELLQLIEEHRIDALHLVPTMFVRLLGLPSEVRSRYDLSSLRHVLHAAAPCPPTIKRAMIEWLGPIVWEFYGSSEISAVTGCNSEEWLAHPGTVGRPLATCTISVRDDDGIPCPPGVPGEIFARAGGMLDFTYVNNPSARASVERHGLISPGDVGYIDDDGFLYICDRKRDMIISGGVNIYPAEIEACLLQLPGVRDCAVFGVPDPEFGESVAAAVEVSQPHQLDSQMVQAHVRAHLAKFKAPKFVEFHDRLPREDSGKVFKRKLREPHWARAGRAI